MELTPLLQKKSAETAVARFSRGFGGPGPHVFNFTCSATTGEVKNTPVLAAKATAEAFRLDFFCNNGANFGSGHRGDEGLITLWS